MTVYRIVNINTDEVMGTFDNYFDARDFCMGRGNYAIDFIEVDDEGFEVEDYDEDYEPFDIDDDFGFDSYMGEYTYDC
jgi:hypothetical protein